MKKAFELKRRMWLSMSLCLMAGGSVFGYDRLVLDMVPHNPGEAPYDSACVDHSDLIRFPKRLIAKLGIEKSTGQQPIARP